MPEICGAAKLVPVTVYTVLFLTKYGVYPIYSGLYSGYHIVHFNRLDNVERRGLDAEGIAVGEIPFVHRLMLWCGGGRDRPPLQ